MSVLLVARLYDQHSSKHVKMKTMTEYMFISKFYRITYQYGWTQILELGLIC